jgi:hypothetical protein
MGTVFPLYFNLVYVVSRLCLGFAGRDRICSETFREYRVVFERTPDEIVDKLLHVA